MLVASAALACSSELPYPPLDEAPIINGPGIPRTSFPEPMLFENCAFLDGGPKDVEDHHNMVTMFDGHLLMPWAPESGEGGLTFFDISDPCKPSIHGTGFSENMRESHSVGITELGGRWYAVVNHLNASDGTGGVQFWDITDPSTPTVVSELQVPGFAYPDAYSRVTLAVFWQAPYVFVSGADNGVYIINAEDPAAPSLAGQLSFEPVLRAGQIQAVGNLLIVTATEGPRTVLLDISDPLSPQPIPGGDFLATNAEGFPKEAYFTNFSGGLIYYARKDNGGGLIIWDVSTPERPSYAGEHFSFGNGGYVFLHEGLAFTGESSFAAIYDVNDLNNIERRAIFDLTGDLDTITPIGHLAILSVDADAAPGEATSVAPWSMTPDANAPRVNFVYPPDGATLVPVTSRIGVTLNEFVQIKSAWRGSVRLYETDGSGEAAIVEGHLSAQEGFVNFSPHAPLRPGTSYTFELPAGGLRDQSGNPMDTAFVSTFTTEP